MSAMIKDEQDIATLSAQCQNDQAASVSQVDASTRDQSIFPFFKLPAEVRNSIYEYALVDKKFVVHFEAGVSEHDGRCT